MLGLVPQSHLPRAACIGWVGQEQRFVRLRRSPVPVGSRLPLYVELRGVGPGIAEADDIGHPVAGRHERRPNWRRTGSLGQTAHLG